MKRGLLDVCVLAAIKNQDSYGYQIIKDIAPYATVSEWLKNNMVSIILFGVAGVLAIAVVVLLFVKPSNETLEDVDKKAKSK